MSRYFTQANGDPRWLNAKYDGTDRNGRRFRRGERVLYFPRTRSIYSGPAAEKEFNAFTSAAADEEQMKGGATY